jgi:hypothetical protein
MGRVLLSHNRRHLVRLHAECVRDRRAHSGIVLIPQDTSLSRLILRATIMLFWLGAEADHRSTLCQWNECQQALIHGYRQSGLTEDDIRLVLGWT